MSKFSRWSGRLGTPNQHNASLPRDFWLEDWEKAAIIAFPALYPLEGYRRLAYMMLDADVVAVSPSSVYRVLRAAGKLAPRGGKPSKKGQGFEQPLRPHEHWHIDVSYLNVFLWGQTDLEFSPLRPRARSSAMRSCLAFDSVWSRAANRADRLGTLSGRERPRIGTSSARVASVSCFSFNKKF